MSLKFLNLEKICKDLKVSYVGTPYGCYPATSNSLRKHKIWVALNEADELKISKNLLNCGNKWLDELAHIKNNDEERWNEFIK